MKKTKIVLELPTDIDALQMVEKETWGEVCYGIYRDATVNNNLRESLNALEKTWKRPFVSINREELENDKKHIE